MEVPDYLEATVYNKDEAVIMVGNFADVTTSEQVSYFSGCFLKHAFFDYEGLSLSILTNIDNEQLYTKNCSNHRH